MLWAQGYHDVCSSQEELLNTCIDPPEWVKVSLLNQIHRHM